ncbi:unnamed protein product [Protopolystoma xenopodis]|uniref:Uncharacterized protein n=1 Tax=Protopolystoma xenopodis TaxID=117903 RepID=A0A3S5BKI9_9PLAT|nr:unnamed protein product [Protopolystoma xenopodis]
MKAESEYLRVCVRVDGFVDVLLREFVWFWDQASAPMLCVCLCKRVDVCFHGSVYVFVASLLDFRVDSLPISLFVAATCSFDVRLQCSSVSFPLFASLRLHSGVSASLCFQILQNDNWSSNFAV